MKRIEVGDFVIPPEFTALQLAQKSAGQIGGLRVELLNTAGKTRLGECYQQVPLRILPPFHFSGESASLLYILNPTAGLLAGDAQLISITARAGTRTIVTGQSANRIHPAGQEFSTQQWHIRVEEGAELVVLPGPTIPYRGSRYYQKVEVELAAEANFIWADIWLPGRYERGDSSEWFAFDRIIQELEIRRGGEPIYRERFDWKGPWTADQRDWFCGLGNGLGNLFSTRSAQSDAWDANPAKPETILRLDSGDQLLRWALPPRELTPRVVEAAFRIAASWSSVEKYWLLESENFPPNHWFSQRV
jgi:urease accessory protein